MRLPLLSVVLAIAVTANALHFYLDANQKRCFIEELPTDTVVEGMCALSEVLFSYFCWLILRFQQEEPSGHTVVKTTGPHDGVFTFTSHEAGDHSICLSTNYTSWFSHTHIRFHLDLVVGSTRPNVEHDRSHVSELSAKLRDLNQKLEDIRREQQYQREREVDYRNLSESTNARAVWYSITQIIVLLVTCAWQLRHLKRFFEDRKMR
ncbi:Transmembrane emp24 domain-containing protein 4 [Leucoagaricus sp. SymC.cos]|nr:Transmembrane emp24 domain-containing protein 4 [Leucoagaricus sp. SymC.cos]